MFKRSALRLASIIFLFGFVLTSFFAQSSVVNSQSEFEEIVNRAEGGITCNDLLEPRLNFRMRIANALMTDKDEIYGILENLITNRLSKGFPELKSQWEDICQEVLMALIQDLNFLISTSPVTAEIHEFLQLVSIATFTKATGFQRKLISQRRYLDPKTSVDIQNPQIINRVSGLNLEDDLINYETIQRINELAKNGLNVVDYQVFWLSFYDQLMDQDIADKLKLPVSTVKGKRYRIIGKIQSWLKDTRTTTSESKRPSRSFKVPRIDSPIHTDPVVSLWS